MKLIKPVLFLCLALLTGCVGHYQQPAPNAAHATLIAKWSTNALISGGFQAYDAYYDNRCTDTDETGVLGAVSESEPEKNRFFIKPDRRIYLIAVSSGTKIHQPTPGSLIGKTCLNVSSFVPKAGATYQMSQSTPEQGCSLKILDMHTGQVPETLVVETVTKECGL
ncbi:hypothetical protein [Pseudomonas cichorii]|uniref:hypothetical protein n=1 Tax=Pseudomonas cichorii TaxID=36746 RepID=UPI001C895153|nr:hypothetical protein [Pseudomonas cichorii]MBX8486797.1 hypothetical protein [Pseudomonas cichorii]MBX8496825.1 hypothetical protein [Pseudomonas cichorii]MBX8531032.1 hypothetical protein [Pseudomonas cichorii]